MNLTLFYATIAVLCLIPAACLGLWMAKYKDFRPAGFGILSFFAFSAICEWFFSYLFMLVVPFTRAFLTADPMRLVVFSCLMAGGFEEFGRMWIYKNGLAAYSGRDTAVGYAIGHFGVEIIILTVIPLLVNTPAEFGSQDMAYYIIERIVACCGHTALSTMVWHAFSAKQIKTAWLAFAVHAVCDSPLGLYKYGFLDHFHAELYFAALVAVLCVLGIIYRRKLPEGMSVDVELLP